ncbi:hypothetical protein HK097_004709, partial [Rhizophlyctis rosea]
MHTFTTYQGLSSRLTTYLPFIYPLPLLATILYGAVIHSQIIATQTDKSIPLTPDQNFQIWQSNIPSRMEQVKVNIGGRKRMVGVVSGVVILAGIVEVADGVVRIVGGEGMYTNLVAGGFGVVRCIQGLVKSQSYLLIALSLFMTSPVIRLIPQDLPKDSSDLDPAYSTSKPYDYSDNYGNSQSRKVHFGNEDDDHSVLTLEPLPQVPRVASVKDDDYNRGKFAGPHHNSSADILYPSAAFTSQRDDNTHRDGGRVDNRAPLMNNVADISTDDDHESGYRSARTDTDNNSTHINTRTAPLAGYAGIGSTSNTGPPGGAHKRGASLGAMNPAIAAQQQAPTKYVPDSYGYDPVRPGYASTIDTASIADSSYTNTTTDTRDN